MPYKNKEDQKQWYINHKEEQTEYKKQYYLNNKEKITKRRKQHYLDYTEIENEQTKQYYLEHPERIKQYMKQYFKTPKGRASQQRGRTNRRVREKNIINTLTTQEWIDILKKYKYRCAYCGCKFDLFNRPTKDHIVPISKGGDNVKENIAPACRSCNSRKGNKILKKGD